MTPLTSNTKSNKINHPILIASLICSIGFVLSILLFINEPKTITSHISQIKTKKDDNNNFIKDYYAVNGTIGDFIGGVAGTIFSLGGFILIYFSFRSQQEALKNQKDQFENEKIESRFFELVNLHRENVSEMEFKSMNAESVHRGRNVFKEIYSQLNYAIIHTTKILNVVPITSVLKTGSFISKYSEDETIKKELIISNLAYSLVFFGVASESFEGLFNALEKDFESSFVKSFISFFKLVPIKESKYHQKWKYSSETRSSQRYITKHFLKKLDIVFYKQKENGQMSRTPAKYYKFFGGHQSKLGHYYRHLFRAVNYIDSKNLKFEVKQEYIRILRAQLSNYEEFLLFFNSVCFIGREWELKHPRESKNSLITKYDLIRNIPYTTYKYKVDDIEYLIDLKNFYPLVTYEFEQVPAAKAKYIQSLHSSE